MSRTRLSPIDILGITLGVLVILIVVGSVVAIARGQMFNFRLSIPTGTAWWGGTEFPVGGLREAKDEEIPAGTFTELEVRNIAGSIDITGSPATGIAVHSEKRASFRAALDNVRVDIQANGNRLVVEEKHDPGVMRRTGSVSFRVTVPKGVRVIEAHSVSGSVAVSGVEPGVDQTLSAISGSVSTSLARNLDISSTSGRVSFASDGGTVNARSVSGSIDGDIKALGGGGSARLSTVSGSVSLGAFAGLDATVNLHSISGSVSCDFPVTISQQKRNTLSGRIGTGSASLDVGTISGSISISKE